MNNKLQVWTAYFITVEGKEFQRDFYASCKQEAFQMANDYLPLSANWRVNSDGQPMLGRDRRKE